MESLYNEGDYALNRDHNLSKKLPVPEMDYIFLIHYYLFLREEISLANFMRQKMLRQSAHCCQGQT